MKEKELKDGERVTFTNSTHKYARAEFSICTKWVRGHISKIHITPLQQPNAKETFVINIPFKTQTYQVASYTYMGITNPNIWLHVWCPEHKCSAFRLYVPEESSQFRVSLLSTPSIYFEK